MEIKLIYLIDLDNTCCKTVDNDYLHSEPRQDAIDEVNRLYDEGHTIKIFTGRGSKSGTNWKGLTEYQLKLWQIKYHELIMGKPVCSFLVDDKAISLADFKLSYDKRVGVLADLIANCKKNDTKVLIAGNGGLDSEASHFSAELVGKYAFDIYISCIALGGNSSILTAVSNDMGFENVFAHQVKVLGNVDDIFIGMTTSHSENIVKALGEAHKKGLTTVVICSTKYKEFEADYIIDIEGKDTAEIQENILKFLHRVAYKAKEKLVEK
jgi:D-sedoheptulose 7-phosphate isomerase